MKPIKRMKRVKQMSVVPALDRISSTEPGKPVLTLFRGLWWVKLFSLGCVVSGAVAVASSEKKSEYDYAKLCKNRETDGAFGLSISACDADAYGDVSRIRYIYKDYVFDRRPRMNSAEFRENQTAYITNTHGLITSMAKDFYQEKHPQAPQDELEAWIRGVLTMSQQESTMSHYRIGKEGRYKLTVADRRDVSHGMFQVNQLYHATRWEMDSSFDLVTHTRVAMEIYHQAWMGVVEKSCFKALVKKKVSRADLLKARAQGAWAGYNGGLGSMCRFANPTHTHAAKDKSYLKKWNKQEWAKYLVDSGKKIALNITCLLNGDDLCALAKEDRGEYLRDRALVLDNGMTCIYPSGSAKLATGYHCAVDSRTFACLAEVDPAVFKSAPLRLRHLPQEDDSKVVYHDRQRLCMQAVKNLIQPGNFARMHKQILIRADIGGKVRGSTVIGSVEPGEVYQILDYGIELNRDGMRYYKIKKDAMTIGYVAGGDDANSHEWISLVAEPAVKTVVYMPVRGSTVEVVLKTGIKVFPEPGSKDGEIASLQAGSRVQVIDVVTMDTDNKIYLGTLLDGHIGYFYAGRTYPEMTIGQWVKVVDFR